MKFIISIILTALLAFVCCLYLPWWFIAVAAFLIAIFIRQSPLKAWLAGFIGIFFLWSLLAILKDSVNDSILSRRIAEMFFLGGSSGLLILVTGLIGAIVGGLGALTGSFVKK